MSFGLLLTRAAGLGDIRNTGSGNIGATNALRTGNYWVAGGTFLGDSLKGVLAVFLGQYFGNPDLAVIAGTGAFLGHLYPVWLRFRGGKGVSTFIGIQLALFWPVGLMFCASWFLVFFLSRYSSLSALVASALTPVYLIWFDQWETARLSLLLVVMILVAHRDNIRRLIAGEEPKTGQKTDT